MEDKLRSCKFKFLTFTSSTTPSNGSGAAKKKDNWYTESITSQNFSIGDMMIYMGKNPRLTATPREFQFAISQYLGKVEQQEMWSDKLITKFLASGLLALNLIGCVQTTDGVYSRQGEDWNESVNFFEIVPGLFICISFQIFLNKFF